MALKATCPSCGAPVVFQSASSVFAICGYCQSTLVREDQHLEDIGKMAAVVEDRSPWQLGAEGVWQGRHFALIGRIQLRYAAGCWNEWYLLFDDMRTGWLSDASGEYVISFPQPLQEPVPEFEALTVGARLWVAGFAWQVTNKEKAQCVAGQGELPFQVGAGYDVPAVDLRLPLARGKDTPHFATLDYSDAPPRFYQGHAVQLADLKAQGLREQHPDMAEQKTIAAKVFRCTACGAPLTARSEEILAVGCSTCGAVIEATGLHQLISRAVVVAQEAEPPLLPLGAKGKWEGDADRSLALEVIGFMVRRSRDAFGTYDWGEYFLAASDGSYRWLVEYHGHWSYVTPCSTLPAVGRGGDQVAIRFAGQEFKHFTRTMAEVRQVMGEFTWRVRIGECWHVDDYMAPPLGLSREKSEQELTWSKSQHVTRETVQAMFRLPKPLPEPLGVGMLEPNPWEETHQKTSAFFFKMALLALALQLFFVFFSPRQVLLRETMEFAAGRTENLYKSGEFALRGRSNKVTLKQQTNLNNHWIGMDLMLVNRQTGQVWRAEREISFYQGNDDGYWSEGSQEDKVAFLDVPAGTYYVTVDPDFQPNLLTDLPSEMRSALEVSRGGISWLNFALLEVFLLLFPIFTRSRVSAFETKRWIESDHPPVTDDGGED